MGTGGLAGAVLGLDARSVHVGDGLNDRRGWAVVAALFVVAMFAWGLAFYGLGFFLRELRDVHGWSVTVLSWVTFGFYITGTALNFVVSRWLGRGRPHRVFATGAVTLAAAVLAIGHVPSLAALIVVYLVMAVGWACLSITPISATVLWWFPADSRAPLTVALTGASVGGIVLVPALDVLSRHYGFATGVGIIAAVELVVVGTLALVVVREPPGTSAGMTSHNGPATAWGIVGRAAYWPLSVGLALGLLVQVGFLVHQLSILDETVPKGTSAFIVSATTAAALVGRIVFVALTARITAAAAGAGFLALQAASLLALAAGGRGAVASLVWSVAFGLGVGVLVVIAPLLTQATFPAEAFTAVFPVVSIGYQTAIAAGAPAAAFAHDWMGGYGPALVVLGLVDVAAAGLIAVNRWQLGRLASTDTAVEPAVGASG